MTNIVNRFVYCEIRNYHDLADQFFAITTEYGRSQLIAIFDILLFVQKMTNVSTDYNRASCRACGPRLVIAKLCHYCNEPTVWNCPQCLAICDSPHVHCIKQRRPEEEEDLRVRAEIKLC
jgi:hypothetical protein